MINYSLLEESLRELSSEQFQREIWTGQTSQLMSSFTEAVCGVFDDSGLGDSVSTGTAQSALGSDLYRLVEELDCAVSNVDSTDSPLTLIESCEMEIVRRIAHRLLTRLQERKE